MNNEILIQTVRDENGCIQNFVNLPLYFGCQNLKYPDVYFAFLIKTLIDDFGETIVKGTNGSVTKEQFETSFMKNLNDLLSEDTRVKNNIEQNKE